MEFTYREWIDKVNEILIAKVGMEENDGEDWPSRHAYSLRYTPLQGALV